ncbi:MAG: hypothetical protein QGH34_03310 [Candidatus Woesearchaeota archaeon]|jgi:hypothetical protein|nr:hypothetical protein [Candidatus Woesearchaeota archaeon]|tara:strand:+ start:4127 stop:4438 length:312 start_codon:yes stop_codon:yes gene_type:complete
MRGLVILLLVLVVIASISFATLNANNKQTETKKSEVFEFSTFTSAVCEDVEDFIRCKDEVFVNCNGEISKATGVAECNGIRLDVPQATGFAVFEKDWKDPRVN